MVCEIVAPQMRISILKVVCVAPILVLGLHISACSDVNSPVVSQLTVQTASQQYRTSDTLRFTIANFLRTETHVLACNLKLSYWLQDLDGSTWRDRHLINLGPCLALHVLYVVLVPNQSRSVQLELTTLPSLAAGKHRIRIGFRFPGQSQLQFSHSDTFDIIN